MFLGEAELRICVCVGECNGRSLRGLPVAEFARGEASGECIFVPKAYDYYERPILLWRHGGGPWKVSLTVTVLISYGRTPEADPPWFWDWVWTAFLAARLKTGKHVFGSLPAGLQVLTVAKTVFVTVSFVGFDAINATVFLEPIIRRQFPSGRFLPRAYKYSYVLEPSISGRGISHTPATGTASCRRKT